MTPFTTGADVFLALFMPREHGMTEVTTLPP